MMTHFRRLAGITAGLALLTTTMLCAADAPPAPDQTPAARTAGDDARLRAVRAFADNVLAHGRDHYGPTPTPLFVDGINVETHQPVEWVYNQQRWIVSNLASQQHLFRSLVGLSALTGDVQYRQAAEAATRYHFEHFLRPCGLPAWGGHRFIDLRTRQVVGEQNSHEFKCSYPYYDFLWTLDPKATRASHQGGVERPCARLAHAGYEPSRHLQPPAGQTLGERIHGRRAVLRG